MCNVLVAESLVDVGPHVAEYLNGLDEFAAAIAPFTPESVVAATGVTAEAIRTLARELAAATTASVYGRIGTTTTEFGSTATWLIDALNILTGNRRKRDEQSQKNNQESYHLSCLLIH